MQVTCGSRKGRHRPGNGPEKSEEPEESGGPDDSEDPASASGGADRVPGGSRTESGEGGGRTGTTYYRNCAAARAAGAAPVHRGEPGYGAHLDRDGDGIGCEGRHR
ncbi:excalibur calcium-binding domain-containing protein [Streptomyces sp. NPDC021100]|uniref:excalibur calcium-binding domain-containing protein n=1 Tax=Streptomyces sp. NPDC021100 TaxID=3365114 RepID=UPI0037A631F9